MSVAGQLSSSSSESLDTPEDAPLATPDTRSNRRRRAMVTPPPSHRQQRRARTRRFLVDDRYDNEEERLFQQALKNSRTDTCRLRIPVPEAPTFYPTEAEFRDPIAYIQTIASAAKQYGICKIVPPNEWNPPRFTSFEYSTKKMATKLQEIHKLQSGEGFEDGESYTASEFKLMADMFYDQWVESRHDGTASLDDLEKDYWDIVEGQKEFVQVEYANDLDTTAFWSGFPPARSADDIGHVTWPMNKSRYYCESGWNLNNLPRWPGSLLRHITTPINGVNVPWLYMGMLFSSFCWHAEDNFLYSINYSHLGSTKQWYSVPGEYAKSFEKVAQASLRMRFDEDSDLIHHMTMQLPPSYFIAKRIPVYQVRQEPKQFVITFPRAFHSGFNYGYNCNEAVNFAAPDWLPFGRQAEEIYRSNQSVRPAVFSHSRLLMTLYHHLETLGEEYQRELRVQIRDMIDEELQTRPAVLLEGVQDRPGLRVPRIRYSSVDTEAVEYDDKRMCFGCKGVCVLSAVACVCDDKLVSCLRHHRDMCKCRVSERFLIPWKSLDDLRQLREELISPTTNARPTACRSMDLHSRVSL